MSRTIGTSTTNSMRIDLDELGFSGIIRQIQVIPIFGNQENDQEERLKDRKKRKFVITARFEKYEYSKKEINFNFKEESGDSLFIFPKDSVKLEVASPDGIFHLFPNDKRFLSTARLECETTSIKEARLFFDRLVSPVIDHFSYIGKTPLFISQISIDDESNHILNTEIIPPYPEVQINTGMGSMTYKLAPVYAMYREGTNATSPFYKFFCFYKILEGLIKKMQGDLQREAKKQNIQIPGLKPKFLEYTDIPDDQIKYVGKSITYFFDDFLTKRFRNNIAHFVTDEGAALHVTSSENIEKYSSVIEATEICCREMISHFEKSISLIDSNNNSKLVSISKNA